MEFIVCNKCGTSPSTCQFHITSCSHVCCESCLSPAPESCPLCKIPAKTLKLDGNLPKNVRKLFGDPTAMMVEAQRKFCKISGFHKSQKLHLAKIELRKSVMRKEQLTKIRQKTDEISAQIGKLTKIEESSEKKLKEAENENEMLEKSIRDLELQIATVPVEIDDDDDDFFMKNTPTMSSPSVGSIQDDDEIFEFDLLGLKNSSDHNSASSNCSSQSTNLELLF